MNCEFLKIADKMLISENSDAISLTRYRIFGKRAAVDKSFEMEFVSLGIAHRFPVIKEDKCQGMTHIILTYVEFFMRLPLDTILWKFSITLTQ